MRYFLGKITEFFQHKSPDAEIVSDVKFHDGVTPYFLVKMKGCQIPVDINAEDIIERFTNKFCQTDIKNATKAVMKYRCILRLASIEKNFAILYNHAEQSYQLVDLSDNLFLRSLDINLLRAEDAFKLGIHFERMRLEKDRKLVSLNRSSRNNVTKFTLVQTDNND